MEDSISDFLFAFLHTNLSEKGIKFFSVRVDPAISEWR